MTKEKRATRGSRAAAIEERTNDTTRWFEHHPDHDHQLLLYDSHDEQYTSVARYIREGLQAGDYCLYIVHENTEAELVDALRDHGIDVEHAVETGRFEIRDATEIYLDDGTFSPGQMIAQLRDCISDAVEDGYSQLRITGEMTWVADHDVDFDQLLSYEQQIETSIPMESYNGLCQYRRDDFSSEQLNSLLNTHPRVTDDAESRLNCYYEPPNHELDTEHSQNIIDQKLETISEQRRLTDSLSERNRCLSLLGQFTEQLQEAEPGEIERIAGDIIEEIVDPACTVFWDYDTTTGDLEPEILQNGLRRRSADAIREQCAEQAWTVFVEDELREVTLDGEPPVAGVLLPVGTHGTMLVGTPNSTSLAATDIAFLKSVCSHTEAALDRLTYERELEQQTTELSEYTTQLERVDQINTVIREISQSLIDATTETELTETLCELLTRHTDACFTWYGTYDPATNALDPMNATGDGRGYLTALSVDDEWSTDGPAGVAARTREPRVQNAIYDDRPFEHWQEEALKREFQSVVSLPVSFDGSLYGVVSVYSDVPDAFDDETVAVLDELSNLVGHALNSIRRKEALVTEAVTELKIRLTETDAYIVPFVARTNARVEIDDVVADSDGGFRLFVTVRGAPPEEIRELGKTSPTIDSLEILSSDDDVHICECEVTDRCFMARLLRHNAVPQSVQIEDEEVNLVFRLPQDIGVREFMEMFTSKYPEAEVVGRQNREQSLRQLSDVESLVEADLTDRQLEILKLAYRSGYFERPRQRTAEDLADDLEVTHPTVTRHLREAERKILSLIFDSSGDG